jgi:chemotaxis response regulator CheB
MVSLILASPVHKVREKAMDKAIRILVANRPKLMRELLLGTLADQPWIEIIGEVTNDAEISELVHQTAPDLLVIATDGPGKRPPICDSLLQVHPELRIIAVAPLQNYSVCYWASLDIHCDDIEPSEEGFLSAVRSVAESTTKRSGVI